MTKGVQVVESMLGREVLLGVYMKKTRSQESNFSHLELDEELGEYMGHGKHELVHKFSHDLV